MVVTAQQLLKERSILEKMKVSKSTEEHFCLDDYIKEDVMNAIEELNQLYPTYHFERKEVFGGYGHDLVVTNIAKKEAFKHIPKTRTYGELFQTLADVYGIHTSAKFHHKPTDRLTEEEFQETITFFENFHTSVLFSDNEEENGDE
ncbi:hypothetical protein SHT67_14175 (plasmid) [Enterococcus faecalis]|uniref:hypothetical protein n=1 Tax=Enterococcus faecalis TaxID=1351 RepID=UPI0029C73778|nr:hypothetical protein [Enterococcus faecalis]WPH48379.1 hypothetical protein SHT67_14175 [Enterococcus faecalis]